MTDLRDTKTVWLSALVAFALYFSGFLVILTPLPLLYAMIVKGARSGYIAMGISALGVIAVYLFVMPASGAVEGTLAYLPAPGAGLSGFMPAGFLRTFGIGYFGFFAAIAYALAWGWGKRQPLSTWGGAALLAGAGAITLTIVATKVICGSGLLEGVRSYMMYALGEIVSVNQSSGMQGTQLAFIADNTDKVAGGIIEILPSLAFVYAVITVAINLVLGRRIVRNKVVGVQAPGVLRFRLADWLIWAVIASGGIFFANSYIVHSPAVRTMALNGIIGLGVLYFLQGMAVTSYFLQRVRFSIVRTIAYIAMIIFLQTVSVALIILGIADVWADFRLRHLRMQDQQG